MKKLLAFVAQGAFEKNIGLAIMAMKAVAGRASGDRVSAAVKRLLQS